MLLDCLDVVLVKDPYNITMDYVFTHFSRSLRLVMYVCIIEHFALCKGGNFNIHIWAWFGYFKRNQVLFIIW